MAQLVERLPCTEEVSGSIPLGSTGFLEIQVTVFISRFPAKGGSASGGDPAWVHSILRDLLLKDLSVYPANPIRVHGLLKDHNSL